MRSSYIGYCRSLVTGRNGLIDHVAEQVPGPVRRDNQVEIEKAGVIEISRETMKRGDLRLLDPRCIDLEVRKIFRNSRLSHIALTAAEAESGHECKAEPFSLLPASKLDAFRTTVRDVCDLSDEQIIEDAYPCSSLQEGLMALAVKQPGSYIAKYVYRLSESVDPTLFKSAWTRTVELCGNLRTRIILFGGASIQTIVKEEARWETTKGLDVRSFMSAVKNIKMQYESRLCRYALVDGEDGERYFALIIHHAIFDGWSLNVILDALHYIYRQSDPPPLQPYSGFINYVAKIDQAAAREYWKLQLDGAQRASFPPPDRKIGSEAESRIMKTTIQFPGLAKTSITKATILRAAWTLVLARYCDTDDVCFGTTVSGRNAPVTGLSKMIGPTIATIPVRVRINRQQSVSSYLRVIQEQASDMIAHEQYGVQNISKLGLGAKEACDFSSLLVIQPVQQLTSAGGETGTALLSVDADIYVTKDVVEGHFTYPLVLQGLMYKDHVKLMLIYKPSIVAEEQLVALSYQFEHVVQQLLAQDEVPLNELSLSGGWDLQQAIDCNAEDPELVCACVHELVEAQAKRHPHSPAICAWDGKFTYSQLDIAANRLAHHLVISAGVKIGGLMHLCFEKSIWFFV